MTSKQGYISNELTHFIGRDKANDTVLYDRLSCILTSRKLTHSPNDTTASKFNGRTISIYHNAKFSKNEMFVPEMVCFCDIPIKELHIHIQKYGPFGISFSKDFIAQNGGSPVYYLPQNAYRASWDKEKLAPFFDRVGIGCYNFIQDKCRPLAGVNADYNDILTYHFLGYIQFFDHNLLEDDPNNFYFEREWRVLGNVKFELKDIQRILLLQKYAKKFEQNFPEYKGEITYTDSYIEK